MKSKILLVDDEPNLLASLQRRLQHADFEITTAISGHQAIATIRQGGIDLIVSDQEMPGMEGTQLLAWVLEYDPDIIRILLTGKSDPRISVRAINEGKVFHYLDKPICSAELEHVVLQGLNKRQLKRENQQLLLRVSEQLEQLNCANVELERSNRELEQFSAIVAHDLRSPLGRIISFCSLINNKELDSESQEMLSGIEETSWRLIGVVESVLNYAHLEQGEIDCQPVDLHQVIQQVQDDLCVIVAETGATLEIAPLPTIQGDAHLLGQMFQNLISNAIKYRGEKAPHVSISADKIQERWQITLRDNGKGIADKDQERIFEAFQQVNHNSPGVGLGLSTCRKIMERHAGNIHIESTLGAGTTFFLAFPNPNIASPASFALEGNS